MRKKITAKGGIEPARRPNRDAVAARLCDSHGVGDHIYLRGRQLLQKVKEGMYLEVLCSDDRHHRALVQSLDRSSGATTLQLPKTCSRREFCGDIHTLYVARDGSFCGGTEKEEVVEHIEGNGAECVADDAITKLPENTVIETTNLIDAKESSEVSATAISEASAQVSSYVSNTRYDRESLWKPRLSFSSRSRRQEKLINSMELQAEAESSKFLNGNALESVAGRVQLPPTHSVKRKRKENAGHPSTTTLSQDRLAPLTVNSTVRTTSKKKKRRIHESIVAVSGENFGKAVLDQEFYHFLSSLCDDSNGNHHSVTPAAAEEGGVPAQSTGIVDSRLISSLSSCVSNGTSKMLDGSELQDSKTRDGKTLDLIRGARISMQLLDEKLGSAGKYHQRRRHPSEDVTVYGPIAREISVTDSAAALLLETLIPLEDLLSFVVTNATDAEYVRSILQQQEATKCIRVYCVSWRRPSQQQWCRILHGLRGRPCLSGSLDAAFGTTRGGYLIDAIDRCSTAVRLFLIKHFALDCIAWTADLKNSEIAGADSSIDIKQLRWTHSLYSRCFIIHLLEPEASAHEVESVLYICESADKISGTRGAYQKSTSKEDQGTGTLSNALKLPLSIPKKRWNFTPLLRSWSDFPPSEEEYDCKYLYCDELNDNTVTAASAVFSKAQKQVGIWLQNVHSLQYEYICSVLLGGKHTEPAREFYHQSNGWGFLPLETFFPSCIPIAYRHTRSRKKDQYRLSLYQHHEVHQLKRLPLLSIVSPVPWKQLMQPLLGLVASESTKGNNSNEEIGLIFPSRVYYEMWISSVIKAHCSEGNAEKLLHAKLQHFDALHAMATDGICFLPLLPSHKAVAQAFHYKEPLICDVTVVPRRCVMIYTIPFPLPQQSILQLHASSGVSVSNSNETKAPMQCIAKSDGRPIWQHIDNNGSVLLDISMQWLVKAKIDEDPDSRKIYRLQQIDQQCVDALGGWNSLLCGFSFPTAPASENTSNALAGNPSNASILSPRAEAAQLLQCVGIDRLASILTRSYDAIKGARRGLLDAIGVNPKYAQQILASQRQLNEVLRLVVHKPIQSFCGKTNPVEADKAVH